MNRIFFIALVIALAGCSAGKIKNKAVGNDPVTILNTNPDGRGPEIILEFRKGRSFYYPIMAVWIESESGKYIQSLYVARSVATGIFKYGKQEKNRWVEAPRRAPQILPYWSHKRGVRASDGLFMPEPDNPVADAYSGPTPVQSFVINTRSDSELPDVFRVLLEINQNWDWNEYWTNDKFPGDENYKWSCQPALVYEAEVRKSDPVKKYLMKPIGHSHPSGKTGDYLKISVHSPLPFILLTQ